MVGYAWVVMILNGAVQYLLLLGTSRLCLKTTHWLSTLLGSVAGGVYAGMCLLPRFGFLSAAFCHFLLLALVGLLTFGFGMDALRQIAVYILLNMALEGIVAGLGTDSLWYCALAVVVLGVLCGLGACGRKKTADYVPLEVSYAGKQLRLTALRDTGNMLTDPLTGQKVLVISPSVASQITGLTQQQLRSPVDALVNARIPGLRLIPYRTVGQGNAFLLALRMEVKQGNKEDKCLVAFAPEEFGQGSTYQALTGGSV